MGGEHPSVAASYDNIGEVWNKKGEYDKALKYYEKSLTIELKSLNRDNPYLATSYSNVGNCNYELKRYLSAIDFFLRGFSVLNRGSFPFQIAKCYEALDNKELALDYFIQSAEIRKSDPEAGINDAVTLDSVQNVLRIAKELGKENELLEWMKNLKC